MEFLSVGAHCERAGCGQQDFLPHNCATCERRYCAEHAAQHACRAATAAVAAPDTPAPPAPSVHCFLPDCTSRDVVPFTCFACRAQTCLRHRDPAAHACVGVVERGAGAARAPAFPKLSKPTLAVPATLSHNTPRYAVREGLVTHSPPGQSSKTAAAAPAPTAKPKSSAGLALDAKVALMKMKGKAKVDPGIPESARCFLQVAAAGVPAPCILCVDVRTPLGQVVDIACAALSVRNPNGETTDPSKRLYLVAEGGGGHALSLDTPIAGLEPPLPSGSALRLQLGSIP